ncbi:hypothetical protein BGZ63DRAFT_415163 [Mariannaea sp. PMI_226]|nr:hypothetical protein BGZ63DRAFT_415163 [Mariannaea sp. PMI_226]
MISQISISLLLGLAYLTHAQSCGGGATFTVSNVHESFGDMILSPRSPYIYRRGDAQICVVNRAPDTFVSITGDQVNGAIFAVLNACCVDGDPCYGGQEKITSETGNVIDLSIQAYGQDCSVHWIE